MKAQADPVVFPQDILASYIQSFYGYGNLQSDFWFVGLEEGGGRHRAEILQRLQQWDTLGKNTVEDIHRFHSALPGTDWFGPRSKTQTTWRQLIRIFLLATTGVVPTAAQILTYQRERLGRENQQTALLELMPLPSRSVRNWIYTAKDLPALDSRKHYVGAFQGMRILGLSRLLEKHEPRNVIFYGARRRWPALLGLDIDRADSFDTSRLGTSTVYFIDHPTSFGAGPLKFARLGMQIAKVQNTQK